MSTADLAERAASTHVVVVGAGIAGLVAARECAKVGIRVTVLEASAHVGGTIRTIDLDGLATDAGADRFSTRGGHLEALLEELGVSGQIVTPDAARTAIAGIPGVGTAPMPAESILGIPASPFHDEVRRIIGWRGAWRAYLDRLRPPLTIGHADSLGRLVERRMGALVRDRLVAPLSLGGFAIHPDDIDIESAVPGLNAALTRAGSLSGAVAELRDERAAKPGSAPFGGLVGGMGQLVDALRAELDLLGAEVRVGARAEALVRSDGGWMVRYAASETALVPSDLDVETTTNADPDTNDDEPTEITADAVIVAAPETAARALLGDVVSGLGDPSAAPEIEVVTLLVDGAGLDDAPTDVFTVSGQRAATAVNRPTAVWRWLRDAAAGREVLRVTFGGPGQAPATAGLSESDAAALALAEAHAILELPEGAVSCVAARRECFTQTLPASALGADPHRRRVRAAIRNVPGLVGVGAWLAGTGLAQVVPDAVAEAERLRHALLWGSPEARHR